MKALCLVENLERYLPLVSKISPTHAQLPILSNILIQATDKGIVLSSTDLELGVMVLIPAKVEEQGSTTIPGRYFSEVVSSLPKDKVSLSLDKESFKLVAGDTNISFQTINPNEFPNFFDNIGEKIHSFSSEEFKTIFSSCIFATSTDESRPQLTGVLLYQTKDDLFFVATDGFRLSVKKTKIKALREGETKIIISSRILSEMLSFKTDKNDKIDMFIDSKNNQVVFKVKDVTIVGRLLEGEFPNYEKVIPSSHTTKAVIKKEDFMQAIKLSSVFARESSNVVKLSINNGKLKLYARSQGVGEGELSLDVEQKGDDNEISFNVKYLMDYLRNSESDMIIMEMNSSTQPAAFKLDGDDSFIHIIMPVRVQE